MKKLEDILAEFKAGKITAEIVAKEIATLQTLDLGHTKIDLARKERTGVGEVIYGAGKTPTQILEIAKALREKNSPLLVTRLNANAMQLLKTEFSEGKANDIARTFSVGVENQNSSEKFVAIVTAGTSDMQVAEEAKATLEFLGSRVECFYDCGVAGLHRLLQKIERIREAEVVIAIAGMEGALASVVAGLVKEPVIAVPTSVGYGANFEGIATLLAMINSCANGVSVVNINNGFGAAYNAHLIAQKSTC